MTDAARSSIAIRVLLPVGVVLAAIAVGLTSYAGVLNIALAPMVTAVAALLLFRNPGAYLSFVLWVWMVAPMIRRLSDLRAGFHPASIILIAPLAVTMLSAVSLLRFRHRLGSVGIIPYVVMLVILGYGFFLGAINNGLLAATLALANWIAPILFATHILVSPEPAREKATAILRALVFGAMFLGLYGIVQFILMPDWDANWIIESGLTSVGAPLPFAVRVFGPLNSPGPYAQVIAGCTLAALATKSKVRGIAVVAGIVGLLLSLVRAAWGAWAIGIILLFYWSAARQKANFLAVAFLTVLVVTPVLAYSPLGERIVDRFATLSDTSTDASFQQRQGLYRTFTEGRITTIRGEGLGGVGEAAVRVSGADQASTEAVTIDSGILEIIFTFGIVGPVLLAALGTAVLRAWPRWNDPFAIAAMTVAFSGLPLIVFGNPFTGVAGMFVYPFLALARCFRISSPEEAETKTAWQPPGSPLEAAS